MFRGMRRRKYTYLNSQYSKPIQPRENAPEIIARIVAELGDQAVVSRRLHVKRCANIAQLLFLDEIDDRVFKQCYIFCPNL